MFKKTINTIKLTKEAQEKLCSVINYTHCKMLNAGIILYSNKNKDFGITPMFVKYEDIEVLVFKK